MNLFSRVDQLGMKGRIRIEMVVLFALVRGIPVGMPYTQVIEVNCEGMKHMQDKELCLDGRH